MTIHAPPTASFRPRLKDSVEVFPASDGHVYLITATGDRDMVIPDAGDFERAVLAALDGTRDQAALGAELGERYPDHGPAGVEEALGALADLGVLEDVAEPVPPELTPDDLERYDRQLSYFGDVAPASGGRFERQARLKRARVVVLGLGGLGSWAAWALASAGVGTIVAVDGDVVDLSNLNRQILYRQDDLGAPKVEVAERALLAFNPHLSFEGHRGWIESPEDVAALVDGADYLVETADWPPHRIGGWVNEACVGAGVPHIAASQFPPFVRIGPSFVPGRTGCLACQEQAVREGFPLFDELARFRSGRRSRAATFGPASGVIGSLLANDVVHHLTGICEPATLGRSLMVDLRTLEVTSEPISRRRDCSVCR